MNAESVPHAEHNHATLRVAVGPLVAPVLARVVGMLAARAQCPLNRLDDALLVADALAAHGQSHVANGHIQIEVAAVPSSLELTVGPLVHEGADELLRAAALPGVGNVLEQVADEIVVAPAEGGGELLKVRIAFAPGDA